MVEEVVGAKCGSVAGMRIAIAILFALTITARADSVFTNNVLLADNATVRDPANVIDDHAVLAAIQATTFGKCAHADDARLLVWLVFDHGKVVAADAAGSGDRKLEACIVKAVRATTLTGSTTRIAASVEIETGLWKAVIGVFTSPSSSRSDAITGTGTAAGSKLESGSGAVIGATVAGSESGPVTHPTSAAAGSGGAAGGLTAEQIDRVVRAHMGIWRACYQKERTNNPGFGGSAVFRFEIDAQGTVIQAEPKTPSPDAAFDACMISNLKKLKFGTGPANVSYPFVFRDG
jgi:hypothetical protein